MAAAPLVGARAALVLALALAAAAASGRPPPPRPVVAAYIPEWRARAVNYTALFAHATHAIFFSLEVDGKAGKPSARDRLPPKEVLDEVHGALRAANAKVDVATPPTRRHAVLCFGGNGRSAGFMGMAKNKKRRSRFVKALVDELAFTGFTGVDYNWEYPGYDMSTGRYLDETSVANEYAALADLVADTRRAFEKYNAKLGADDPQARLTEISVAYYPDSRQERLLVEHGIAEAADFLHAMAYDAGGPEGHASMQLATRVVDQAVSLFGAGVAAKVTLGLPFYGRELRTGAWHTYEDLVQKHHPLGAEVDLVDGIAFNGRATIAKKTRLAVSRGLAGVMVWEGGQDCRYAAVARGAEAHGVTCPDGAASSLFAAVSGALPVRARGDEL